MNSIQNNLMNWWWRDVNTVGRLWVPHAFYSLANRGPRLDRGPFLCAELPWACQRKGIDRIRITRLHFFEQRPFSLLLNLPPTC